VTTGDTDTLYYDPFDIEIDRDPYPVWRRLREEAPLWYNEPLDFYALSRFDDVDAALRDWDTYRSGQGSTLDFIKAEIEIPPGIILMEDPPVHDVHRGLMARVFTARRMHALEDKVRAFCARSLDPLVGEPGFDFIRDLGAQVPMRTIGRRLGIPEQDQEAIRDRMDAALSLEHGGPMQESPEDGFGFAVFEQYLDWRREHPADDLMTELLFTEFEDETGTVRTLTREEAVTYIALIAGAGNETATRLIGWSGKLLAEHPDQRRQLVADPSKLGPAIEEILRFEAPSPVQARVTSRPVDWYGRTVPAGSAVVLINGSANRDDRAFPDAERFDINRKPGRHLSFGFGIHFCLGASLARVEGRVALEEVLKRWPEWDVDWEHAKQAHTPHVRGWERLPVVVGR
jgi:cytochrome P450